MSSGVCQGTTTIGGPCKRKRPASSAADPWFCSTHSSQSGLASPPLSPRISSSSKRRPTAAATSGSDDNNLVRSRPASSTIPAAGTSALPTLSSLWILVPVLLLVGVLTPQTLALTKLWFFGTIQDAAYAGNSMILSGFLISNPIAAAQEIDSQGDTPLHKACMRAADQSDIISKLIENGASPIATNAVSLTPMHYCALLPHGSSLHSLLRLPTVTQVPVHIKFSAIPNWQMLDSADTVPPVFGVLLNRWSHHPQHFDADFLSSALLLLDLHHETIGELHSTTISLQYTLAATLCILAEVAEHHPASTSSIATLYQRLFSSDHIVSDPDDVAGRFICRSASSAMPLLHRVISSGAMPLFHALMEAQHPRIDPNLAYDNRPPLTWVGSKKAAHLLILAGANVNAAIPSSSERSESLLEHLLFALARSSSATAPSSADLHSESPSTVIALSQFSTDRCFNSLSRDSTNERECARERGRIILLLLDRKATIPAVEGQALLHSVLVRPIQAGSLKADGDISLPPPIDLRLHLVALGNFAAITGFTMPLRPLPMPHAGQQIEITLGDETDQLFVLDRSLLPPIDTHLAALLTLQLHCSIFSSVLPHAAVLHNEIPCQSHLISVTKSEALFLGVADSIPTSLYIRIQARQRACVLSLTLSHRES